MDCIRCAGRMQKRPVRGVLLDYCAPCNAIWLDKGELEALLSRRSRTRAELQAQEQAEVSRESSRAVSVLELCPRCQGRLSVTYIRTVPVDQCSRCGGMYFDQGELPAILRALRRGPLARLWMRLRGSLTAGA